MQPFRFFLTPVLTGLVALAFAGGTPADTEITNQASATYHDSAGQAQSTTSNQVVTIVQQVYEISITPNGADATTPGQTKRVLSGATAYFSYVVTNSGNGSDTIALEAVEDTGDTFAFSRTTSYGDDNCNGTIDTGEASLASLTLEADGSACIILAAVTPSGRLNGATGNVDLQGNSSGSASDSGNWARAVITDAATFDARLSLTPQGTVASGDTLGVTVSGSNTGASAAYGVDSSAYTGVAGQRGIVITAALPAEVTFAGGLNSSAGAGSATPIYFTGTWSTTVPADLGTVTAVGAVLVGSGGFFPQTASYSLGFSVTVDSGVSAGTVIVHPGAELRYSSDGTDSDTATSNSSSVTMGRSFAVAVGPWTDPSALGSGSRSNHGGWTVTVPVADQQRIDTADTPVYTGDAVVFKHSLKNSGNSADGFTLAASGAPVDWNCAMRHIDTSTPISGSVGPFAADATFDFSLVCSIPQANANALAGAITLTVTATSTGDGRSDTTTDIVPAVLPGYGVTTTSAGAATIAPQTATPGGSFTIPFEVANDGGNSDVYSLGSALPSGWSGRFYSDANCDGVRDATLVTRSERLAAGASACFVFDGSVPGSATPSNGSAIALTATSTTDATVTSGVNGSFSVVTVASISFNPERSGTVTTPGTIAYTLDLRNNGNSSASVDVPAASSGHGWNYQLSTDNSTWSASLTNVTVLPAGSTPVYVRVIVPAGQPIGRIETTVFTATGTFTRPDGSTLGSSDTATVTSTVVGGDLTLAKSARTCTDATCSGVTDAGGATATPGSFIEYTLVAKNIGTANISEVIVMDPLPNHTDFVSASATTSVAAPAVVLYANDGRSWSSDAATLAPGTGGAIYVGLDTSGNGAVDGADTLAPSHTITLTFVVRVR